LKKSYLCFREVQRKMVLEEKMPLEQALQAQGAAEVANFSSAPEENPHPNTRINSISR
jgi:hypothetical protein